MKLSYGIALFLTLVLQNAWADAPIPTQEALLLTQEAQQYWQASLSGGPGKDGIPSIDRPRFHPAHQTELKGEDIVMGVYLDGQARAYPQSILVWHEIVNDAIGDINIAITYCPLTATGIGFLRGDTELGVSGRLVNSNMLMYDRATDTYWPQIAATGVKGPLTGQGLQEFRVVWTTWGRWLARHPQTEVLSQRTGFARNYRRDPYGSYSPKGGYYAEPSGVMFPLMNESSRYPSKREMIGFRTATEAIAIDKQALRDVQVMRYLGERQDFLILYDDGLDSAWVLQGSHGAIPDNLTLADVDFGPTGPVGERLAGLSPVNAFDVFWFAWYAFYPQTVVLDGKNQ